MSATQEASGSTDDPLLTWCNDKLRGHRGIEVKDFSSSWKTGLALLALLQCQSATPLALPPWTTLEQNSSRENLELAFQKSSLLGVPCPLTVDSVLTSTDLRSAPLRSYLESLRRFFTSPNSATTATVVYGRDQLKEVMDLMSHLSTKRNTPSPHSSALSGNSGAVADESRRYSLPPPGMLSPSPSPTLRRIDRDTEAVLARVGMGGAFMSVGLESTRNETVRSLDKLHEVDADLKRLDDKLTRARRETDRAREQLEEKQRHKLAEIERERREHEREIDALQRQLDAVKAAGRAESQEHRELRKRLEREKVENEKAAAAMKTIMDELAQIRQRLAAEAAVRQELERQRSDKERERETLQRRHDATMGRLKQMLDHALEEEKTRAGQAVDVGLVLQDRTRARDVAASENRMTQMRVTTERDAAQALSSQSEKAGKEKERATANKELEEEQLARRERELREARSKKKKASAALDIATTDRDYQDRLRLMTLEEVEELENDLESEMRRTDANKKLASELQRGAAEVSEKAEEERDNAEQVVAALDARKEQELSVLSTRLDAAKKRAQELHKDLQQSRTKVSQEIDSIAEQVKARGDAALDHLATKERAARANEEARTELGGMQQHTKTLAEELQRAQSLVSDNQGRARKQAVVLKKHTGEKAKAEKTLEATRKAKSASELVKDGALSELERARDKQLAAQSAKKKATEQFTAAADHVAELTEAAADVRYDLEKDVETAAADADNANAAHAAALEAAERKLKHDVEEKELARSAQEKLLAETKLRADAASEELASAERTKSDAAAAAGAAAARVKAASEAIDNAKQDQERLASELEMQQRREATALDQYKAAASRLKQQEDRVAKAAADGSREVAESERAELERKLEMAREEAEEERRLARATVEDAERVYREELEMERRAAEEEREEDLKELDAESARRLDQLRRQQQELRRQNERRIREAQKRLELASQELSAEQSERQRLQLKAK